MKSHKVVLVDDNEEMTELYEHYFQQDALDWKVFRNGFDALDYLRERDDVDAVVLDLAMPTLDGLTVSQQIRINENTHPERKPVKIAYFTAYDKTRAIENIIEKERIEKYFVKPMPVDELISKVKEWLN
jgi:CheY-like chemotaxis protein